jgi:hypothetical protein
MRSIVLALAFFAPAAAAFAAPADYTSPIVSVHATKPQQVMLTFQNNTVHDRILRVGDRQFHIRPTEHFSTVAAVGSVVRMYSDQDSKVDGQPLLTVSANDSHRYITIN